ncbi:glycosyltransferase [Cellulosimicrobium sp. NPDC057127]|uniref:glycosyltransferase n=1 Tax=Cellulosimicrobium sp. NPDC057127 TaxID=3346026 RepID=UPI0036351DDE
MREEGGPVRVVMHPDPARAGTNPFVPDLVASLPSWCEVSPYSWWRATTGRYDVLHVHWPEYLLLARRRPRTVGKAVLGLTAAAWARARGRSVVWTVHNAEPHAGHDALSRTVLRVWARLADRHVHLSRAGAAAAGPARAAVTVIEHADYSSSTGVRRAHDGPRRGLLLFGRILPYKGVEELLDAYARLRSRAQGAVPRLTILGDAPDPDYRAEVERRVEDVEGVTLRIGHVDDVELHAAIRTAAAVVAPYRRIGSSGVVLLALTLGTPVIARASSSMAELRDEVGEQWLRLFDDTTDPDALVAALSTAEDEVPAGLPDLSRRAPRSVGRRYGDLYRSTVRGAR